MKRIVIAGASCCGKTTLAKELSCKLDISHTELDEFFWGPNWQMAESEDFLRRVDAFTSSEKWITDGDYGQARELTWGRATTVIWLDYPLRIILFRLFTRTFRRVFAKEVLWNGNRETLWNCLFSPKSLLIWILQTYRRKKRRFAALIDSGDFSKAEFVHLKHPAETEKFLETLYS